MKWFVIIVHFTCRICLCINFKVTFSFQYKLCRLRNLVWARLVRHIDCSEMKQLFLDSLEQAHFSLICWNVDSTTCSTTSTTNYDILLILHNILLMSDCITRMGNSNDSHGQSLHLIYLVSHFYTAAILQSVVSDIDNFGAFLVIVHQTLKHSQSFLP